MRPTPSELMLVDITTGSPRGSDRFWLDTNVLYWRTYSPANLRALI